jgi:hypothetical protein
MFIGADALYYHSICGLCLAGVYMKHVMRIVLILLLCMTAHVFSGEIVTRANGQKILIKDDNTWEAVTEKSPECNSFAPGKDIALPEDAIEVWNKALCLIDADKGKAVALYLHYSNNTDKKVVGITVYFAIENTFGDIAFEDTVKEEVVLEAYEKKRSDTFWRFSDNPFLVDEPYDRLWQIAQNGTAKIHTRIIKVIFEDGTTLPPAKPIKKK